MAGASTETTPAQSRRRILVVDDDRDIRESRPSILIDDEFEVCTALNGLELRRAVRERPSPDPVALDLRMLVLDCHQFLSMLRKRGLPSHIPVIVVSAVPFRLTNGSGTNIPKPIHSRSSLELAHRHRASGSQLHQRPAVMH